VMVEGFYRQFEFVETPDDSGEGTLWCLEVERYVPREVFIREATAGSEVQ